MYYSAKEFHAKIMKHCTDLKNNNSANEMFIPHHNFSIELTSKLEYYCPQKFIGVLAQIKKMQKTTFFLIKDYSKF